MLLIRPNVCTNTHMYTHTNARVYTERDISLIQTYIYLTEYTLVNFWSTRWQALSSSRLLTSQLTTHLTNLSLSYRHLATSSSRIFTTSPPHHLTTHLTYLSNRLTTILPPHHFTCSSSRPLTSSPARLFTISTARLLAISPARHLASSPHTSPTCHLFPCHLDTSTSHLLTTRLTYLSTISHARHLACSSSNLLASILTISPPCHRTTHLAHLLATSPSCFLAILSVRHLGSLQAQYNSELTFAEEEYIQNLPSNSELASFATITCVIWTQQIKNEGNTTGTHKSRSTRGVWGAREARSYERNA